MTVSLADARTAQIDQDVAENDRRLRMLVLTAALPIAVVVVIVAVVLAAVAPIAMVIWLVVGAACTAGVVVFLRLRADAMVLGPLGARTADQPQDSRYRNLVEGLCVTSGLVEPSLYVVDDEVPNLAVVGCAPDRASLVVTSGLLARLDRIELEGVLAHGLSRIVDHGIAPATLAAALSTITPGEIRERLIAYGSPRGTIEEADLSAVALTRYPPGLIAALSKFDASKQLTIAVPRTQSNLWFVDPVAVSQSSASDTADATYPPLAERIERLREM